MKLLYKILRQDPGSRQGVVIATSVLGILVNFLLAGVKIAVGTLVSSIAIVSEGINNASDSASSLLTIIGTRLAEKRPTQKHPFGFGRVEYLTSLIIAMLILFTGGEFLISSIKLVVHPEPVSISYVTLAIIAVSAVVKLWLGAFTTKKGEQVSSGSLVAVGRDCKNDSLVSAVTITSALIFLLFHRSVDAWAGIITSGFIIKSGLEVMGDAVAVILGKPADKALADELYREIRAVPEIYNAADMMLHNYGPDMYTGSVNIEVDHGKTIGELYAVIHELQLQIMQKYGVVMVFGMYAVDYDDPRQAELRRSIAEFVTASGHVCSYHALYLPEGVKQIYCDLVVDYDLPDSGALDADFRAFMAARYPGYELMLTIETEYV
jgi:cation diffusion facilitator family transporter